jgi:hypothetical protein
MAKDKPFWIWDATMHKVQDIKTKGNCCFNHIIGLPQKNGVEKPLFDYEKTIFDSLQSHKHVWIKKATGLGITEFMLRFMIWICFKEGENNNSNNDTGTDSDYFSNATTTSLSGSQMCIVTGPRIDLAIGLIDRMKRLIHNRNPGIRFDTKETIIELNGVRIEAFPSHNLDAMRGLPNVSFILLDEADFFPPGQQQDARDVSERYIAKSNPYIVMVSTPNLPGGLFEKIELEQPCIYKKIYLPYRMGLGKIYSHQEIEKAKQSPSFEREYNLHYGYGIGNIFLEDILDNAIDRGTNDIQFSDIGEIDNHGRNNSFTVASQNQRSMGVDPGFGNSKFAICITEAIDGVIRVLYAKEFDRPSTDIMLDIIWDLHNRYNIDNIYIDSSAPGLIQSLKVMLNDEGNNHSDYLNTHIAQERWPFIMKVVPVNFRQEGREMLERTRIFMDNGWIVIHKRHQGLIQQLRIAKTKEDGNLDKSQYSLDLVDALRLSIKHYEEADGP